MPKNVKARRHNERGNVLFIILIAVALIGILTAVIQNSNNSDSANIDDETLAIKITEVQSYASELERAVLYIMESGKSESDIRFAHADAHSDYGDLSADPDPSDQVFHRDGGAANYRTPPAGLNDGSAWEFFGGTHLPAIGTGRADLIAVLPNATQAFCDRINEINGQSGTPTDTSACLGNVVTDRFDDSDQFVSAPNTVDEATFEQDPAYSAVRPAPQACVRCADSNNYLYYVLLAR